jgi:hypothetical protein
MKQRKIVELNSEQTVSESFRMWISLQLARILKHVNKNITPVKWGKGN